MKIQIQRLDYKKVSPLLAWLYLVSGIVSIIIGLLKVIFFDSHLNILGITALFGLVVYPISGYVTGVIFCWAYNLYYRTGGGFIVDCRILENDEKTS